MYAKYTVVLKDLLEHEPTRGKIEKALSTYPLYKKRSKEEYIPSIIPTREELNKKILNAFKYREIGFETVGRFIDELEITMNEIMPYYNQLYLTADQDFNMVYNVDYKREIDTQRAGKNDSETDSNVNKESNTVTDSHVNSETTSTAKDSSTSESSNVDSTKNVNSKTPQSELSITGANIDQVKYADEVSWNKSESDGNTNTEGNSEENTKNESSGNVTAKNTDKGNENSVYSATNESNEKTLERTVGNYGQVSAQSLIDRYRDIIINIDQKIINDRRIQELFMQVY